MENDNETLHLSGVAGTRRTGADAKRRVLLVGGAGYVGCPVADHLLSEGLDVRVLDLFVYGHEAASTPLRSRDGYELVVGDMGDPQVMDRALAGVTDVVILAGLVGDPITKAFPDAAFAVNDLGVQRCIEALEGRGIDRVIFVSTCSNYGLREDGTPATEMAELKPLSLYAKSKVAAERTLLAKRGKVDYAATVLRFSTAFGVAPRMRFDLTINEFVRELFLDRELLVFDAHTWRPYCHVRDFARLIHHVLCADRQAVGFEVFNAGMDQNNHTKQDIVDLVTSRLPGRRVTYRDNSSDPRNYRVDFAKLRDDLGFKCEVSAADGVDEIIAAFERGRFADVEDRRDFYGNYDLVNLPASSRDADVVPVAAVAGAR